MQPGVAPGGGGEGEGEEDQDLGYCDDELGVVWAVEEEGEVPNHSHLFIAAMNVPIGSHQEEGSRHVPACGAGAWSWTSRTCPVKETR